MNLKEFKNEFRLICSDTWGNALDAWFECCGHLDKKGAKIPAKYEYRKGASNDGRDKDSYWFSLFRVCTVTQLRVIGEFLFRYCQYLKFKEVDY